jgi:hypothetical protein
MSSVVVRDRKFTYTRLSLTDGEVEETTTSHIVVATPLSDKYVLTFFNIAQDGHLNMVRGVHHVLKFDAGEVISDE